MKPYVADPKSHSDLGASVASRWMACPGSNNLARTLPRSTNDGTNIHAQEGTAAHALAEVCLRKAQDAQMFVGVSFNGVEVTDDMAEHVQVFVDYCGALVAMSDKVWIEHRFNLSALKPPGPMYGTGDFVAYDADLYELEVVDLKFGMGVVVEVQGNKQLPYYGLGAVLSPEMQGLRIDTVKLTICQPRVGHPDGVIRSVTLTLDELLGFTNELLDAARATYAPDAPLHAGSHCRWCPASGLCPEQFSRAQAVAMVEFKELPVDAPPPPESLPDELFVEMLGKLHILDDWMTAMRAVAQARLERGIPVPGFKLVAKRATRKWVDAEEATAWLLAGANTTLSIFDTKLKSPTQIEKLIGKKNLPSDLVIAVSSGNNMVPSFDPRPAVTLGSEFVVPLSAYSPLFLSAGHETVTQ